jgi:hypothetical protein
MKKVKESDKKVDPSKKSKTNFYFLKKKALTKGSLVYFYI